MQSLDKINWREFSPNPVIGVDEVGRGCLAGAVFAAAVSFRSEALSDLVTDSKLLSEKRREDLYSQIFEFHDVNIAFATVEEIDELNILNASLLAMKRAVEGLRVNGKLVRSGHCLVDGNKKIKNLSSKFQQTTIIKGDLRAAPISAASIVAKVTRDRLMKEMAETFPQYGLEKHKGYSTKIHKEAIAQWGPCEIHRKTFAGVKEHLSRLNPPLSTLR